MVHSRGCAVARPGRRAPALGSDADAVVSAKARGDAVGARGARRTRRVPNMHGRALNGSWPGFEGHSALTILCCDPLAIALTAAAAARR
jgi:hypothetical protein